jgi:alpha-tubulin suppressor-like RCC1 family protein
MTFGTWHHRAARASDRHSQLGRLALITACVGVFAACSSGSSAPQQELLPPPTSVTQTVGANGATIAGPNGVSLSIPAGALAADLEITVAIDPNPPAAPDDFTRTGDALSLTPHGTMFGVPITLTMPVDASQVPAGSTLLVLKTIGDSGQWQQLVPQRTGDTLTVAMTGFSRVVRGVIDTSHLFRFLRHPQDSPAVSEGQSWTFEAEAGSVARPLAYQWLVNDVPIRYETNPRILVSAIRATQNGEQYALRVTQPNGRTIVSNPAILTVAAAAPVFGPESSPEPLDAEVSEGANATFSVQVISSASYTLQWSRSTDDGTNWVPLQGETSPVLVLPNVANADDGDLVRATATNTGGSTDSRNARLTVIAAPVQPGIDTQPQHATVAPGSSATFSVAATGGDLTYSWERQLRSTDPYQPVADSNRSSITIPNVAFNNDGNFLRVRISNPVGSILSGAARLTVTRTPGSALTRVGAGFAHSIGLRASGRLRAWGLSQEGELGDGQSGPHIAVADVLNINAAATMAVGANHTLVILGNSSAEVWGWGRSDFGALGVNASQATPVRIMGLAPARHVAASTGSQFSLAALATDEGDGGEVWAWGSNFRGELGDGTLTNRATPLRVGTISNAVRVSAGNSHAFALTSEGSVWGWGANERGQLGDGTMTASLEPIPIAMPRRMAEVLAGDRSSLALAQDGSVWAWGEGGDGQLGNGSFLASPTPQQVPIPEPPAVAIALGRFHALVLLNDGQVYSWGLNTDGQCGCAGPVQAGEDPRISRPLRIRSLPPNIIAIAAGSRHSLAMDSDGNVWGWGDNRQEQLNDSTAPRHFVPVQARDINLN